MRKRMMVFMSILMVSALTACGSNGSGNSSRIQTVKSAVSESTQEPTEQPGEAATEAITEVMTDASTETPTEELTEAPAENADTEPETEEENGKTLVVYYSASGNTEAVAGYIAEAVNADTLELVPVEPYSDEDLDWTADGSRVNQEHDDESLRDIELVETTAADWDSYDTVFIGYPIWWGNAAWPVDGFIEANDFTGKTVIPFCTSASSGLGESDKLLAEAAGTGNWLEGQRFSSGASEEEVQAWVNGLGLQ